jgi:hypothetical protein
MITTALIRCVLPDLRRLSGAEEVVARAMGWMPA